MGHELQQFISAAEHHVQCWGIQKYNAIEFFKKELFKSKSLLKFYNTNTVSKHG